MCVDESLCINLYSTYVLYICVCALVTVRTWGDVERGGKLYIEG